MCLASNLVKEAAAHADSAAAADKALREIDHEKTTFTRREIESQRHDLVIIEDRVYDADRFQWAHPGGSLFVAMFGGRDGTLAFQSYHMRNFPHEKLRPYLRGRLAPGETITRFDQDHLELSKKLGGAAPYFAPRHQQYKAAFIWALAFALEAYALTVRRSWALATVLGFLYAMIGLNIQHDANHGTGSASFDLSTMIRHRCVSSRNRILSRRGRERESDRGDGIVARPRRRETASPRRRRSYTAEPTAEPRAHR